MRRDLFTDQLLNKSEVRNQVLYRLNHGGSMSGPPARNNFPFYVKRKEDY